MRVRPKVHQPQQESPKVPSSGRPGNGIGMGRAESSDFSGCPQCSASLWIRDGVFLSNIPQQTFIPRIHQTLSWTGLWCYLPQRSMTWRPMNEPCRTPRGDSFLLFSTWQLPVFFDAVTFSSAMYYWDIAEKNCAVVVQPPKINGVPFWKVTNAGFSVRIL